MNKFLLAYFILSASNLASASQCLNIFTKNDLTLSEYDAAYNELLKPIKLLDPNPQPLKVSDISHKWHGDPKSQDPVIVLIHGLGGSHFSWNTVAPLLHKKTGARVLTYDQRGHGRTKDEGLTFTSELLAQDLNELFKFYNIQDAILVGHSMGARTAMEFAYLFPQKVNGVLVEDMHMMGRKTVLSHHRDIAIKIKNTLSGKSFQSENEAFTAIENVFDKNDIEGIEVFFEQEIYVNKKMEFTVSDRAHVSYLYYAQGLQKDFTRELRSTNKPLLFLAATIDPVLFGKGIDHIRTNQPNAEIIEIPFVGHSIHNKIPGDFIQKLIKFMKNSRTKESE